MARGRRRIDAVETPVTNKAQCSSHRGLPTLPEPAVPGTDDMMRALFGRPPKADPKETK